ncbi:MAG: choline dehydrogenase [Hyperionvirus sp.]|uniref:Choline dehydrogenase n=1 Tax=Hyperionvirus sp. TaxID=2487770 RepID=A0A3G5ABT2_9VIRU|nr:MAG: choline dehydrogenase [Hyperionvirus sp.]
MSDYRRKYLKYKKKYLDVMKVYDHIIIGGGTAGSVVAARLSEMEGVEILLLEAGKNFEPDEFPDELVDVESIGSMKYDWGYRSAPGYIEHAIQLPRAKVIGGCSAHNAAAAIRGTSENFERWSQDVSGWEFADVLPYYKKLENCNFGVDQWHGRSGPLPIRIDGKESPFSKSFIASGMMLGYEYIEDINNGHQLGVGLVAMNVIDGERQNTAMVYLTKGVRKRKNLRILGLSEVEKVVVEEGGAVGVVLFNGSVFWARREIVVCGGTFGSCEILKRSGIGPRKELEKSGIQVVVDSPVGSVLYDHPFYYNVYQLKKNVDLDEGVNGPFLWDGDIMIVAWSDQKTLTLGVALTQPISRGSYSYGKIDLNFLFEEHDRKRMVEAVKLAREIVYKGALADLIERELYPGEKVKSAEALEQAIMDDIDSFGHPVSTVAMGTVLDEFCRVRGIKNLRVVDASVFPYPVSCPPNVTVIMVAEKISDHIKKSYYNSI